MCALACGRNHNNINQHDGGASLYSLSGHGRANVCVRSRISRLSPGASCSFLKSTSNMAAKPQLSLPRDHGYSSEFMVISASLGTLCCGVSSGGIKRQPLVLVRGMGPGLKLVRLAWGGDTGEGAGGMGCRRGGRSLKQTGVGV